MERDPSCFQLWFIEILRRIIVRFSTYHDKRIHDLLRKHIIGQHRNWPVFDFFFQPRLSFRLNIKVAFLSHIAKFCTSPGRCLLNPVYTRAYIRHDLKAYTRTNRCMENRVKELQQGIRPPSNHTRFPNRAPNSHYVYSRFFVAIPSND